MPVLFVCGSFQLVQGKKLDKPPHIVMMVIDDLGWNDVPWNNPDSLAVNMGHYARQGVILDRQYVHTKCSPSRAALLTGRYAWRTGNQRGAVERYQPTGLPTEYTLLPQRLKEAGYATHAVGKWHLGYCNIKYFPTRRGFDTFFGILQQSVNYRSRQVPCASYSFRKGMIGYDLRRNESVSYDYEKEFSPIMYAKESQAIIEKHNPSQPLFLYLPFMSVHTPFVGTIPNRYRSLLGGRKRTLYDENYDYEEGFRNSADKKELTLAVLDAQIRKVINSLKKNGLYENSIILVTTDNGGGGQSSNRPLRGHKETLYEGGIRGAAFLLSPLLKNPGTKFEGFIHLVDWFPTFLNLAGVRVKDDIDGLDIWDQINAGSRSTWKSARKQIIHNIDQDDDRGLFQGTIQVQLEK